MRAFGRPAGAALESKPRGPGDPGRYIQYHVPVVRFAPEGLSRSAGTVEADAHLEGKIWLPADVERGAVRYSWRIGRNVHGVSGGSAASARRPWVVRSASWSDQSTHRIPATPLAALGRAVH